MHLNNLNPMLFVTGEPNLSSNQMGSIGSNQNMTMGGIEGPIHTQNS